MNTPTLVAASALAISLSTPVLGHAQIVYTAELLGANEVPAVESPGYGSATITLDEDAMTLRVQATFQDLVGTVTAAHIHCCTPEPGVGNIGVATPTPTFPGFPADVSTGSYDQTFDLSLASSWNTAFINLNGGTVAGAFEAFTAGLATQRAYFNVHTTFATGGEIRGTLVPEPSAFALAGVGLAVAALALRRSRRQGGTS